MRTNPFQGTGVAVVTPFTAEGEVDLLTLREHIRHLVDEGGVDFLCVLGTTAETPTLSLQERELIIETFVDGSPAVRLRRKQHRQRLFLSRRERL